MADPSRDLKVRLAVRVWAAVNARQRALGPVTAAFEAALPDRIREDERFQQALKDADTAEALKEAMTAHRDELDEWAAKGLALLRAVESADDAYERELDKALVSYRDSMAKDREENGTSGTPPREGSG